MACYHPLKGWRSKKKNVKGNYVITFKLREGWKDREMQVACGQCVGCRLERSRQWAMRCMHEASLHEDNTFVTLTYNDENVPEQLIKRDVQLFMKSLRWEYKEKRIRYYMCGEYGEKLSRPHYHLIIFGLEFKDKKLWKEENGYKHYRSKTLEKIWTKGYSTIGTVTFESAAYVARYLMKKILGKGADEHYKGIQAEYTCMSRRPGIARDWIEKYSDQVYTHDGVVIKGRLCKPAKYYDIIYDLTNPKDLERIKKNRKEEMYKHAKNNTPERLKVREKCKIAKIKILTRELKEII